MIIIVKKIYRKIKIYFRFIWVPEVNIYNYNSTQEYKQTQIQGNIRKENQVWAQEDDIKFLANYIQSGNKNARYGLCHGTRNGAEQAFFLKYMQGNAEVLGTEISPTASRYPHTIEWDFHNVKPEWLGKYDFVYSNALDHSHSPELCIEKWISCLNPKGVLIIEWSINNVNVDSLDPFGATLAGIKRMVSKRHKIRKILKRRHKSRATSYFIVISKFN